MRHPVPARSSLQLAAFNARDPQRGRPLAWSDRYARWFDTPSMVSIVMTSSIEFEARYRQTGPADRNEGAQTERPTSRTIDKYRSRTCLRRGSHAISNWFAMIRAQLSGFGFVDY
jgi:hypothetical protein